MGLTVHFEVLNQLGTPMLYSDTLALRPAAGITGRIFFRTDSPYGIYRDNGTSWDLVGSSTAGGGTVTSVAALNVITIGTDIASSVINPTTTPVITLQIPTASATNRGALSTTDWSAFNAKFTLPALTTGSVLFSNGTTIAQDNTNFFWDDTNNRLGIGTNSALAVLNSANTGALTLDSNDANYSGFGLYIRAPASTNTVSSAIGFGVAARKYAAIAMQTYTDADQVGLNFYVQPTASGPSAFLTEAMRIRYDGNVLINSSTDLGYKLLVNGTSIFQDNLSVIKTGNALLTVQASTITSPVADIELMRGTNATWGADGFGDYRFRNSGGDLIFQYGDTGVTSTRFTIFSSGNAQFENDLTVLSTVTSTVTATGITGLVTTATPNSSFSNNFTFNSGISTVASLNVIGVLSDNNLNYSGANTINSTSYNGSAVWRNNITFGAASASITYTQATGIRALTNQQSIYLQSGANSGTISHYANFQIFGDQKLGAGLTTFTNRYQILLNDYAEFSAGNTYTNRWAIYQAGASNTNYFNGKIITGSSTTVSTFQLDVTGTSRLSGSTTITGSTTAVSASAVGITLSPTLVASANSDKLAALIIQPTFSNGAFTNVTNMPFSIITSGSLDVTRFGTLTAYINSTFNTDGTAVSDVISHSTTGTNGKIFQFAASTFNTTPGISFLSTNEMGLSFNNTSLNMSDCSSSFPGTRKQTFFRSTGSVLIQNGGTHTEDTSAMLNVVSTTKGFLPPRMTTTQKNAITTPAAGLVIFDTTLAKLCVYSGAAWQTITSV